MIGRLGRGAPWLLLPLAVLGCKRGSAPSSSTEPTPPAPTASAASTAHPLAPPRCKRRPDTIALGGSSAPEDLEIGRAIAARGGFVVGLLRKVQGVETGSLALLGAQARSPTFIDLGPPAADGPPPMPVARGDGQETLLAAFYGRGRPGGETRELMLFDVSAGKPTLLGVVEEQKDDSLAFDVALGEKGGLVVWDEDQGGARGEAGRGVIKALALSAGGKPLGAPKIVSGATADAELPRVVARRAGYSIAYLAHAPEPPLPATASSTQPGADLEGPGTDRSFGWVEVVAVDEQGASLGSPRRVTSDRGHVSDFVLAARSSQGKGDDAIDLLAHDTGEAQEGSGGRILHATVRVAGADPPAVVVPESVGAAEMELVRKGGSTLLFYGDPEDGLRAVPLGDAMVPLAPPSVEAGLGGASGGRILGEREGSPLVSLPGDAELVLADCEMP